MQQLKPHKDIWKFMRNLDVKSCQNRYSKDRAQKRQPEDRNRLHTSRRVLGRDGQCLTFEQWPSVETPVKTPVTQETVELESTAQTIC